MPTRMQQNAVVIPAETIEDAVCQYVEPVECKPWCVDQDGHPCSTHVEDQWCETESLRIDLSLEDTLDGGVYDAGTQTWLPGPDYVEVYAIQRPGRPVGFTIAQAERRGPMLAATEVRQLIESLQLALGQVEAVAG